MRTGDGLRLLPRLHPEADRERYPDDIRRRGDGGGRHQGRVSTGEKH